MKVFEEAHIGNCKLANRLIRSATFEGMANEKGIPSQSYIDLYSSLAEKNIGALITGFVFINEQGKAMQPGQAGINIPEAVSVYKELTKKVHSRGSKIFLQIAHTGRQTLQSATNLDVVGASGKRSLYFNQRTKAVTKGEIVEIINDFANAAYNAKLAGFDGIQIHAAHGYLIHQFLHPGINSRTDEYGIDKTIRIGTRFLEQILEKTREKCGDNFPILVKISGSDDLNPKISINQFKNLLRFLDKQKVSAIEISYGTMDYALNIFRGDLPEKVVLAKNPIYKNSNKVLRSLWPWLFLPLMKAKLKGFTPTYNLPYAEIAKTITNIPILSVGGFRSGEEIENTIEEKHIDFVSLCRPFICEPEFAEKLKNNNKYKSKCTNCNICAVMCDSDSATRCYLNTNI